MREAVKKVVLAYSGGLDTSVILRWLQETYRCEVVTFTADLGGWHRNSACRNRQKYSRTTKHASLPRNVLMMILRVSDDGKERSEVVLAHLGELDVAIAFIERRLGG